MQTTHQPPVMLTTVGTPARRWLADSGGLVLVLALLITGNLLALRVFGMSQHVDVGTWGDQDSLSGVFDPEMDAGGGT